MFHRGAELRNVSEKEDRQTSSLGAVRWADLTLVLRPFQTHEDGVEAFHDNGGGDEDRPVDGLGIGPQTFQ